MAKEQEYADQLRALGIYEDAYKPAIHELCILERELSRARKQLKALNPGGAAPLTDPLYAVIRQLQTSILAYRDALGLTPKSLRRLKGCQAAARPMAPAVETPLSLLQKKHGAIRQSEPPA